MSPNKKKIQRENEVEETGRRRREKVNLLESVYWVYNPHEIFLCSVKTYIVGGCGKRERFGDRGGGDNCLFVLKKTKTMKLYEKTCVIRRVDRDCNSSFSSAVLD